MDIKPLLQEIGFTEGESKVYLALLELGSSTTGPIIEKSHVSASKVYQILDRLFHKGVISYIVKEKTRIYSAQDPSMLLDFLDKEEQRIKLEKQKINDILPQLQLMKSSGAKEPEVQILEGKRGFVTAYNILLGGMEKSGHYLGWAPISVVKAYSQFFTEIDKKREAMEAHLFIMYETFQQSKEKMEIRKKRKYFFPRVFPKNIKIPSQISVSLKHCLISLYDKDIITILISNPNLVRNYREFLISIWKLSKDAPGYKNKIEPFA